MAEVEYPRPDWMNYRYRLEMWLPNAIAEPQRMGMNDLDAAWLTAVAIAKDGTWHNVSIIDNINNMEWGRISSMKWYQGAAPNAQYAPAEKAEESTDNGED